MLGEMIKQVKELGREVAQILVSADDPEDSGLMNDQIGPKCAAQQEGQGEDESSP